jgi:hypothetical protein
MSKEKEKELKWFSLSDIGESLNIIGDALEKHVKATEGLSKEEIKRKIDEQWLEEFFRRASAERDKKKASS